MPLAKLHVVEGRLRLRMPASGASLEESHDDVQRALHQTLGQLS
jgi:hypothetical protein